MNHIRGLVVYLAAISLFSALTISQVAAADPSYTLNIADVPASPGQHDVMIPVLLSNIDSIGAWEILVDYDTDGGTVTEVEIRDSAQAIDPDGGSIMWFYAPWVGHPERMPEYVHGNIGMGGYMNLVHITGLVEADFQQPIIPPIPPGQRHLLFCLALDVNAQVKDRTISFEFYTRDNCRDNTLSNPGGDKLWLPDTFSVPPSFCPGVPLYQKIIRLVDGDVIIDDGAVDENQHSPAIPKEFNLFQNHPNPFNPITAIEYALPRSCQVKLEIFDLLGRWVSTLVDGQQPAGYRRVQWAASGLPSGVYFYRLQAGEYVETRKMTLLK